MTSVVICRPSEDNFLDMDSFLEMIHSLDLIYIR